MHLLLLLVVCFLNNLSAMENIPLDSGENILAFPCHLLDKQISLDAAMALDAYEDYFFKHEQLAIQHKTELYKNKKSCSLQSLDPIISLQAQVSQNIYDKKNMFLLNAMETASATFNDPEVGAITKIDVGLESSTKLHITLRINQDKNSATEHKHIVPLEGGAQGLCLDINQKTKEIFIGCDNGEIYSYKPQQNTFKKDKTLSHHKAAIVALKMHCYHEALISKSSNNDICLWNLHSYAPGIVIQPNCHRKDYITRGAIVQSHARKSLLTQMLDGDNVYTIPLYWLLKPKNDLDHNYYIYQLKKLLQLKKINVNEQEKIPQELKQEHEKIEKKLNGLYNMSLLKTFEPEVTAVFKKFIEYHAQRLGCTVQDDTFIK